jgi:hypothetical protein
MPDEEPEIDPAAGRLAADSLVELGWLGSDARALQQLRRREDLNSPEAVFRWVSLHYRQALATNPVLPCASLQSQLQRPSLRLWCDEGAILIALLNQQLGQRTHLVDPLDTRTGISHHTTLQVLERGRWTTYDFTSARSGLPLARGVTYPAVPRYRYYPANALQQLLLHNALARGAVSQWRQQQRSQAQTP